MDSSRRRTSPRALVEPQDKNGRGSKINTEHLRTFLEIARANSFTKAARNRKRSQPGVSAQIRALEQELDAALFRRYTHSIALTEAGEVFVRYAEQILELHWRAKCEIERVRTVEQG